MAELTSDKIRQFLHPFLDTLLAPDIVTLRTCLLSAQKEHDIPSSLRSALRLNQFLFPPHKVSQMILPEFDSLLEKRCRSGRLVSQEHLNWIKDFIIKHLVNNLKNCEDIQNKTTENVKDVPPIIYQIACKFIYSIAGLSEETPEILAKLSGNSTKLVLVAKHPIIILSIFINQIEDWFTAFPGQISEVHFVAQHLFLADCSLEQQKWHGVNVSIICNKFECVKTSDEIIHWNLSGQNGKKHDSVKTDQDKNGIDGFVGENGGNLVIVAKEFKGMENLNVISNAGSGGNGQHGGDGKDGEPGKQMSYAKLTTLFPPSVVSSKEGRQLLLKNAINLTKGRPREKLLISPETGFDQNTENITQNLDECFVEGATKNGLRVILFFRSSFCTKSVLCLVKGTAGLPGNRAGLGGLPGKPGQPGIVQFFNFNNLEEPLNSDDIEIAEIQSKAGEFGNTGADGVNGSYGESGKDVGYIFVNDKELGKYQGGKYEMITEYQKTCINSVRNKLLGEKFLRIDSQIGNPYNVVSETIFRGDPSDMEIYHHNSNMTIPLTGNNTFLIKNSLVEQYGSYISSSESGNWFGLTTDGKWWKQAIVNISENHS